MTYVKVGRENSTDIAFADEVNATRLDFLDGTGAATNGHGAVAAGRERAS